MEQMRATTVRTTGFFLWCALCIVPALSTAQAQTSDAPAALDSTALRTPRGALWRAAAVPGWGQLYNRQYLKIPVVYAAMGGLAYYAADLNQQYRLYRQAYQYKSWQERVESGQATENPSAEFAGAYAELEAQFGPISSSALQPRRNILRRNRDFSLIGIGLVYGLSILDAYISAHLFDFDISEDLTASLAPGPQGLTASLRLDL